ncbi:MAG: hypothetical protein EPN97_08860 [Alphaproteobacteria bacterium]|nr:MAG: hypothetical protein EPN97_08860 [Alphaproteobacteria bacterium]
MAFAEKFEMFKDWCLGTRSKEEAESGIKRDVNAREVLKLWSKRLGKATIVLGVLALLTHAGFMIAPAVVACVGYLGVKAAGYLVDRDMRAKREAAEEFVAAQNSVQQTSSPSRQPGPKLTAKATGSFNADAAKKTALPAANANVQKPSGGLLKRFGIG